MKNFNLVNLINLLIFIGGLIVLVYLSGYYSYFKYGKRYNPHRNQFKIVEISEKLYCTYKSNKQLRFSATKKTKDLSIFIDSIGYMGHIDKFIFFDKEHYEEDVFIDVKKEDTYFYRCFYYYDDNSKKCTISNSEGKKNIACSVIDSIFNTNFNKY